MDGPFDGQKQYTHSVHDPFPSFVVYNNPQIGVLNIFSHTLVDSWEGVQWNDLSSLHPNSGMVSHESLQKVSHFNCQWSDKVLSIQSWLITCSASHLRPCLCEWFPTDFHCPGFVTKKVLWNHEEYNVFRLFSLWHGSFCRLSHRLLTLGEWLDNCPKKPPTGSKIHLGHLVQTWNPRITSYETLENSMEIMCHLPTPFRVSMLDILGCL